MSDTDSLLARGRKLLAMAEDPACTPAEAEAFTAKATDLIAKYGVDQALLAAADPTIDPVGDRIVTVVPPYARDKAGLLAAVAAPLRCRIVHLERRGVARSHLFRPPRPPRHPGPPQRAPRSLPPLLAGRLHGSDPQPAVRRGEVRGGGRT